MVTGFGGTSWPRMIASALEREGMLHSYVSPVIATPRAERAVSRLPSALERPVRRQLRLRPLPPGVPPGKARLAGTSLELASVLGLRARLPQRALDRLQILAAAQFDRGVSRMLGGHESVVTTYCGAAEATHRTARELGVGTVLDYPIAHHRFFERLLAEEETLRPDFAGTLQYQRVPPRYRARLEREIDSADRVLMLSSFQRRTFIESGVPESKLELTPLGVDAEQFRPPPPEERPERFTVLMAGQIGQRKGLSYLLDGFGAAKLPEAELALLGRPVGSTSAWRDRPGVVHRPPVPFDALPREYAAAHVFALPSLVESFPLTALQAMACGLPVIVSENTFAEDVITDGVDGYIVPIRDSGAIAERIRHLHDNPAERERMGEAASRRAAEFGWDRYGERVAAVIRSLCG